MQNATIYFCIILELQNIAIYFFITISATRAYFPFVAKVFAYQPIMEDITYFFDFERNIYEERGYIGATILESSKVIASHTLELHGPTTSHTSLEQRTMEAHEDMQIIKEWATYRELCQSFANNAKYWVEQYKSSPP